jgi:hypothetical protein
MNSGTADVPRKNNVHAGTKASPLARDILWSGGRYAVVFSRLSGMDRDALAARLDWLVANNPHLALDRSHQRGSRAYRERQPKAPASSLIFAVHEPVPGRGQQSWATEFMAESPEAIFQIRLVGDDYYFLISHLLGDFSGVLPLCEFVLRGGDGSRLVDLRPTPSSLIMRAVGRKLRRQPLAVWRTGKEILSGAARGARPNSVTSGVTSVAPRQPPIRVACWPAAYRGTLGYQAESASRPGSSPLSTAKIITEAVKAAADLGIPLDQSVSVLVDCRHWLGPSESPLVGNLASVLPIDAAPGGNDGNVSRQLRKHFRESSPLIRLMLSDIYVRFFARWKRRASTQRSGASTSDAIKLIVTNLGEIKMMGPLRETFPEAGFSGVISAPTEGCSTLFLFKFLDKEEIGMLSTSHLSFEDVRKWRDVILERLFA